jgi:hypothetical protein
MARPTFYFGNCIDCHAYGRLDRDGRCVHCAVQEMKLVDAACLLLQKHPDATREEIARILDVDQDKVDRWARNRNIHCVSLRSRCPICLEPLVNCFSCRNCGYDLLHELRRAVKEKERGRRRDAFHTIDSHRRKRYKHS